MERPLASGASGCDDLGFGARVGGLASAVGGVTGMAVDDLGAAVLREAGRLAGAGVFATLVVAAFPARGCALAGVAETAVAFELFPDFGFCADPGGGLGRGVVGLAVATVDF